MTTTAPAMPTAPSATIPPHRSGSPAGRGASVRRIALLAVAAAGGGLALSGVGFVAWVVLSHAGSPPAGYGG